MPSGRPSPLAGVVAIGGGLGFNEVWPVPGEVVWALVLLGAAGFLATRTPVPWLVGPLAAIPGGVFLADASDGGFPSWVKVVLVLGPALIGVAAADLDRRGARFGIGPVLFGISVLGMYATVPDTEVARVAVGVMLPLVFLAWPRALASMGAAGMYAAAGLYLWIVPIESVGRPGAMIGALGAFGLLVTEPVGRALRKHYAHRLPELPRIHSRHVLATTVLAQLIVVFYASRVAGFEAEPLGALIVLVPGLVGAIALGGLVAVPEPRIHRHRLRPRPSLDPDAPLLPDPETLGGDPPPGGYRGQFN